MKLWEICVIWSIVAVFNVAGSNSPDFQFKDDVVDVQHFYTEPLDIDTPSHHASKASSCPYSEDKILLSLVLRGRTWNEVVQRKRDRAINKLAKFFMVTKDDLNIDDVTKTELYEMSKNSLHRGKNQLASSSKKFGRLEFEIGCGKQLYPTGKLISNQIGHQMKDGSINDISGLDFGWWVIWTKRVNNKTARLRRQAEGSGEVEDDDEDDYYLDYEDGDAESQTNQPISTTTAHPHRHHHGKQTFDEDNSEQEHESTTEEQHAEQPGSSSTATTNTPFSQSSQLPNTPSSPVLSASESPFSVTNNNVVDTTTTDSDQTQSTTLPPAISSANNNFNTASNTLLPSSIGDTVDPSSSSYAPPSVISTTTSSSADTTTVTSIDNTGYVQTETTNPTPRATSATPFVEENYDDEYDDEIDENAASPASQPSQSTVTAQTFPTTTQIITQRTTTQEPEPEVRNTPPMLRNRLPKTPVTAGKAFKIAVPEENFYDAEDGTNLNLELLDKNEHVLKSDSWIQFNQKTREIYGLPLEGVVSRWRYILRATDSSNESVQEDLDISVQQHKGHRSVNHEIELQVKLNEKFERNIDWQLKLMDAITEVLGDSSNQNIVVREIRPHINDLNAWTFVYTNESLPKDTCPELEAEELVEKLHIDDLNRVLGADINVRNVQEVMVGNCKKAVTKPKVSTFAPAKNFPPVLRNQVDRVNATVGQLLVYRVPTDTFYDPEDENDLQLSLLSQDRQKLDPHYWLQFDVRNREFYGIPKPGDFGQREYLLVAKDRGGLTATDALVVVVNHSQKRDYGVLFDFNLGISFDDFNRSTIQRRFIEKVARVFDDSNTNHILVRQIRRIPQTQNVAITFYNTTLHRHHRCPTADIEELRSILLHPDSSIRDRVKDTLSEFHLQSVNLHPIGACQGADTITHEIPVKPDEPPPHQPDDYLLTFVLPAIIILAMLLLASIVACYLHRKRLTGKMELGDEEERKSFRSKGIPVIFQDELDEKPEIATKSPIILKDEKPPLLPPSYNQTNPDDDDMDEYVPPPGVGPIGARETRGKSPVTPSYRKPPPYVSP
ncbi:dystroglycan 1 isoform X2 [Culicoides brevitarsis]|uniref:dystroglycan 1 isoform X2 n=1 Tax=Culicoides brevitarsis TaxID=469753 RepID=UPI00307BB8B9